MRISVRGNVEETKESGPGQGSTSASPYVGASGRALSSRNLFAPPEQRRRKPDLSHGLFSRPDTGPRFTDPTGPGLPRRLVHSSTAGQRSRRESGPRSNVLQFSTLGPRTSARRQSHAASRRRPETARRRDRTVSQQERKQRQPQCSPAGRQSYDVLLQNCHFSQDKVATTCPQQRHSTPPPSHSTRAVPFRTTVAFFESPATRAAHATLPADRSRCSDADAAMLPENFTPPHILFDSLGFVAGRLDDGRRVNEAWHLYLWTLPDASPATSRSTSSTETRLKSPGIVCLSALAATAKRSASSGLRPVTSP